MTTNPSYLCFSASHTVTTKIAATSIHSQNDIRVARLDAHSDHFERRSDFDAREYVRFRLDESWMRHGTRLAPAEADGNLFDDEARP